MSENRYRQTTDMLPPEWSSSSTITGELHHAHGEILENISDAIIKDSIDHVLIYNPFADQNSPENIITTAANRMSFMGMAVEEGFNRLKRLIEENDETRQKIYDWLFLSKMECVKQGIDWGDFYDTVAEQLICLCNRSNDIDSTLQSHIKTTIPEKVRNNDWLFVLVVCKMYRWKIITASAAFQKIHQSSLKTQETHQTM